MDINGTAEPVRGTMLRLTQLFNITGHPAIALPAAQDVDPLPRSVQIVGRRHETDLLTMAAAVERWLQRGCRGGTEKTGTLSTVC